GGVLVASVQTTPTPRFIPLRTPFSASGGVPIGSILLDQSDTGAQLSDTFVVQSDARWRLDLACETASALAGRAVVVVPRAGETQRRVAARCPGTNSAMETVTGPFWLRIMTPDDGTSWHLTVTMYLPTPTPQTWDHP